MSHYPIFLELAGRPCVVVGGGAVAERKVAALAAAGARVTVVSPTLTPALAERAQAGQIGWVSRAYRPGDLAGAQLAVVAADDPETSAAVAGEGRQRGVWVNAADEPDRCDFILPSILRRGPLTVAVATGGACPALSRVVREELESHLTEDWAGLADLAGEVRRELRGRGRAPGAGAWRSALAGDLRRLVGGGRREEARRRLLERLAGEA